MVQGPVSNGGAAAVPCAAIATPVRHWLLVQLSLGITGWIVILLGISCFI